jgi:hypothetical protein
MDVDRHVVTVAGSSVPLPLKEFELLELLLRNTGRVLTRMQLIDRVWGSDYVGDTKTLDVHVKRLRAKIEQDPANPTLLVTVRGSGTSSRRNAASRSAGRRGGRLGARRARRRGRGGRLLVDRVARDGAARLGLGSAPRSVGEGIGVSPAGTSPVSVPVGDGAPVGVMDAYSRVAASTGVWITVEPPSGELIVIGTTAPAGSGMLANCTTAALAALVPGEDVGSPAVAPS